MDSIARERTTSTQGAKVQKLADVVARDPVAQFLLNTNRVRRVDRDGRLHITCPWEIDHTTDGGDIATTYLPVHTGASVESHFQCSHCERRGDQQFLDAISFASPGFAGEFKAADPSPAADSEPLHATLEFTTFPDVHAKAADRGRKTWGELRDMITDAEERPTKKACQLLKLATFGGKRTIKGSLRHDDNMLQVFGVEGDYDGGQVQPLQAAKMLESASIEALVYTTPSHTPQAPRWRVVAPLSAPCEPKERARFVGMLNAALGGILAPESFKPSQTYYFGRVRGAEYEVRQARGACIDTLTIDPVYPSAKEPKPDATAPGRAAVIERVDESTIADLRAALAAIDADPYVTWTDVGNNLACLGDVGRELWLQWSARSAKFDQEEANAKWSSFTGDRSDYRAVFTKAADAGWQNPGPSTPVSSGEFVDITAQERDEARRELDAWDIVGGTPERAQELAARLDSSEAAEYLKRFGLRPKKPRFASSSLDDILAEPPMQWLIEGVLPQAEFGMVYGEPRTGKSFVVADMALSVARGVAWRGIPTKQCRVAYIVAEGSRGFSQRLQAYQHQQQVELAQIPFAIHRREAVPNLSDAKEARAFAEQVMAEGGAGLVIVDTLAQSIGGVNENSGEDMQPVIDNCKLISTITGALVLVVHHSGKDASRGARGWSGLYGACDVQLKVERDLAGEGTLHVPKLKDEEDGAAYGFKLQKVIYGVREDGKELTSCIVVHTAEAPRSVRGLGGVQRIAFDAAGELAEDGTRVSREQLEDAVVARLDRGTGSRDRRPEYAHRAVSDLLRRGLLRTDADEKIAMPQSANAPQTDV